MNSKLQNISSLLNLKQQKPKRNIVILNHSSKKKLKFSLVMENSNFWSTLDLFKKNVNVLCIFRCYSKRLDNLNNIMRK